MPYHARVFVTLKEGVLDPQGKAVQQGLSTLGYTSVKEVRVGRYIQVTVEAESLSAAQAQIDEVCRRILANPVIEDYEFEIQATNAESSQLGS